MVDRLSDKAEVASGRFFMGIMALGQLGIFLGIIVYLIPNTSGFWLILSICGALFFGSAALMFLIYLLPNRPISDFIIRQDCYLILRPRSLSFCHGIISIFSAIILPVVVLYFIALTPLAIAYNDTISLPDLGNESLFSLMVMAYETIDATHGMIFTIIPLLIAFPWLYPKFLLLTKTSVLHMFSDSGLKLDVDGLSVIGPHAKFIPWTWLTDVELAVHGQTEVIVLKGGSELESLKVGLDPRLPKAITKGLIWEKDGVPMKLEFLRVRATELAEVIRSQFLNKSGS